MNAATHLPEPPLCPDLEKNLVGRTCSFLETAGKVRGRVLVGSIESASYLGRTIRGSIPDYDLSIRGGSGAVLRGVSLVENRVILK